MIGLARVSLMGEAKILKSDQLAQDFIGHFFQELQDLSQGKPLLPCDGLTWC